MQPKNIFSITEKDLRIAFNSPAAYIIMAVFLLVGGWFFSSTLFIANQATLQDFMEPLPLLFVFLIPAITMRLLAEEAKLGTIETLSTLPVYDYEIVLGKYLAGLALFLCAILPTIFFLIILSALGKPDWGQIAGGYIGILFLGATYLSIGLLATSLTRNQVVAFIIGFFLCFLLFILGKVAPLTGVFGPLVEAMGIDRHYDTFSKGVLDIRDILYFVSLIVFFVTFAITMVAGRRHK